MSYQCKKKNKYCGYAIFSTCLSIFLAFATFFLCVLSYRQYEQSLLLIKEQQKLTAKIESFENELACLEKESSAASLSIEKLVNELNALKTRLEDSENNLDLLKEELKLLQLELENLKIENGKKDDEILSKRLYCQYDSTMNYEKSVGGLKIYIPTHVGYINYNLGHSINQSSNCDMWRLTIAYAYDDNLENKYAITTAGEWDMALHLANRPDFIGGHAHGDEVYTSLSFYIDDIQKEITTVTELTTFEELRIEVHSIGYDPNDHTTQVLKHYKEFIVDESGVELNQRVEWLGDYSLTSCYMAMMPPSKAYTDSYYTDVDTSLKDIESNSFQVKSCKTAVLVGKESNLRYSMSIPKYPSYDTGNFFLMTDNGGGAYNKMYFVVCRSASVTKGEIWETTTKYNIIHT